MEEIKPYIDDNKGRVSYRTFTKDVSEEELVWHRDPEDRSIKATQNTDWKIQYDNELPRPLSSSFEYFIPEGVYHRLIKGSGDLNVKIVRHKK